MRFALQCRNSAAWRKAQGAPEVCPHGLRIGHSPDGVKRGDYAAPQAALTAEAVASARGQRPDRPACAHLTVLPGGGCCDWEFICGRDGGRREIQPTECATCDDRK
jgi:hypothetical protein